MGIVDSRAQHIGRRTVLGAGALAGAGAFGFLGTQPAAAAVTTDPFALGVAAGDPLPDGLILWTRLVKDPSSAASLARRDVPVWYEVATDANFARVVRRGLTVAHARWAHSVHLDLRHLRPSTDYYYRFRVGPYVSPAGSARTAPRLETASGAIRFAIANCQDYQNGYWPAYTAMADEDIDFVLHLGDYIYEYDPKSAYPDRQHTTPQQTGLDQLLTLSDYRARHAQYKLDPALQAAHARAAWIAVWDDHEVENNYASDIDEEDLPPANQPPASFRRERAHAYQAYYEHMPIRVKYRRGSSRLRLYRAFDFGCLLRMSVLDTRQYRTDQPPDILQDFGLEASGEQNAGGTLTGAIQERWLQRKLSGSAARWNVIAQQTMMSRTRFPASLNGSTFLTNLDQWDGYAPFRERVLSFVRDSQVTNPVVLSGDIHSTWMNDIVVDPDDPHAPVVASEFVSTSISSAFLDAFDTPIKQTLSTLNPRTRYYDGSRRGYLLMDVNSQRWLTQARTVASIASRTSPISTTAAFAVEAGTPGIVPA